MLEEVSFLGGFWAVFFKSRGCSQDGRQTEGMGGKEAENTFSIKIMCVSWPAKLRKKVCVVCGI